MSILFYKKIQINIGGIRGSIVFIFHEDGYEEEVDKAVASATGSLKSVKSGPAKNGNQKSTNVRNTKQTSGKANNGKILNARTSNVRPDMARPEKTRNER